MRLVLDILGILGWFADCGALLYLIGVARDHWGIQWHGMRSIVVCGSILLVILLGSGLLAACGATGTAAIVAAAPPILALGGLGGLLLIYLVGGGRPN